jgi:hypothetical protein
MYEKLDKVLADAYQQASDGKGKERHAGGKPFDRQPIMEIGRMVGPGFGLGQAMKKAQEAARMIDRGNPMHARHELLGAINYLASVVILIDEQTENPPF